MSLRGFRTNTVGPKDGQDALGGDCMMAVSGDLTWKLPGDVLRELDVRGRVFANAGNVVAMSGPSPVSDFVERVRLSVGLGIVIPSRFGRFELSYCRPVFREADDIGDAIQVGIGMDFL